jgi:hypothetical protein
VLFLKRPEFLEIFLPHLLYSLIDFLKQHRRYKKTILPNPTLELQTAFLKLIEE